ncbi:MAG: hypothetical protein G01um101425_440 [Candidatus Peregrinibacteria bacterium Gr01-1014_25]|nr:MAG: hypothetical protein G01um101425_440 [Candidatus Peregrinibacteria bacterium Gr01-1014_25]
MSLDEQRLEALMKAMPNMVGFSTFDGPYVEAALQKLPAEQQQLLIVLMDKGSRLEAAKAIGGGEVGKAAEAVRQITAALAALRKNFDDVLNALR